MPETLSISCRDLAPVRGGRVVAEGVSFDVGPGAALVLRGANGSGKTSVLRAVAGLCIYSGEVGFRSASGPIDLGEARARYVHFLGAGDGLTAKLSVAEHERFWAGLYGVPPAGAPERVGLLDLADRPAGRLSTGQRRRLGLARLLMASRPVWLLDEPLSGLDGAGREMLRRAIAEHRAMGGLVLIATHEEEGLPDAPTLRLTAPQAA